MTEQSTDARPRLQAVVFDMDGVLVDSEPLWHEAEREVFSRCGLELSVADCQQTTGVRIDTVVAHWRARRPECFVDVDDAAVVDAIVAAVVARVRARAEPMRGAREAVAWCHERGLRVGLASSSPMVLIDAVLERLQLRALFQTVQSAELLPRGKPDPLVYQLACKALGVDVAAACAVEDSSSGIRAGVAAGMYVVAVPDRAAAAPAALGEAHAVIDDLTALPTRLAPLLA